MSLNPPPLNLNETSLLPFETLPDELLLSIFQCLDPLKRSLMLSICKKWNDTLLLNRSLWTVLHLPRAYSFEESISILRIFNARSGFRLKHMILEADMTNGQQLGEVFHELQKSGGSLRLLSLTQSAFLNKETRTLTRKLLPNLNTLNLLDPMEYHSMRIPNMLRVRKERGIQDADEELRYLRCTHFFRFDQSEHRWLSTLLSFRAHGVSFRDLRSVLKATQSTLESLSLFDWSIMGDDEPSSESSQPKVSSDEVDMKRLKHLEVPSKGDEARSLTRLLGRVESVEMLAGEVNTLTAFDFRNVKHLTVYSYDEEEDQEQLENLEPLRLRTESLFKLNKSVEELVLECPNTRRGGETQIDLTFELLCNRSETQSPPEVHLPNLVKLTIMDPIKLDGKLLSKLVQERKALAESFKLTCVDPSNKEILIEDWEARGWMN